MLTSIRVANAVNLDAGEVLLYSGHLVDSIAMPANGDIEVTNGDIEVSVIR